VHYRGAQSPALALFELNIEFQDSIMTLLGSSFACVYPASSSILLLPAFLSFSEVASFAGARVSSP